MLRDVMRRCPAIQVNRLTLFNEIAACQADRLLGFNVLHKPGHDISFRWRACAERSAMGPLHQPLPRQDVKIFSQRGLAHFEDRSQFIQMDPPATCDESRDFLLSLCGKNGRGRIFGVFGHKRGEENCSRRDEYLNRKKIYVNQEKAAVFDIAISWRFKTKRM